MHLFSDYFIAGECLSKDSFNNSSLSTIPCGCMESLSIKQIG